MFTAIWFARAPECCNLWDFLRHLLKPRFQASIFIYYNYFLFPNNFDCPLHIFGVLWKVSFPFSSIITWCWHITSSQLPAHSLWIVLKFLNLWLYFFDIKRDSLYENVLHFNFWLQLIDGINMSVYYEHFKRKLHDHSIYKEFISYNYKS